MVRYSFGRGAVTFFHGARSTRSPFIRREFSPSDMSIRPVNKTGWVVAPPLTRLLRMTEVKVKDVVADIVTGSSVELSSTERNAYKQLDIAILP